MESVPSPSPQPTILLDRDELLARREKGLLSNNLDYLSLVLELEYPGRMTAQINPKVIAERWTTQKKPISSADVMIALSRLVKKGHLEIPHCQFGVVMVEPEATGEPS